MLGGWQMAYINLEKKLFLNSEFITDEPYHELIAFFKVLFDTKYAVRLLMISLKWKLYDYF